MTFSVDYCQRQYFPVIFYILNDQVNKQHTTKDSKHECEKTFLTRSLKFRSLSSLFKPLSIVSSNLTIKERRDNLTHLMVL